MLRFLLLSSAYILSIPFLILGVMAMLDIFLGFEMLQSKIITENKWLLIAGPFVALYVILVKYYTRNSPTDN